MYLIDATNTKIHEILEKLSANIAIHIGKHRSILLTAPKSIVQVVSQSKNAQIFPNWCMIFFQKKRKLLTVTLTSEIFA